MNNDLISRAAAIKVVKAMVYDPDMGDDAATFGCMVWGVLDRLPAVDAVEVVRCRDCKHYRGGVCKEITYIMDGYYNGTFEMKSPDDFCSSGEKMGGDVNVG